MTSVLIIDDHPIVLQGCRRMLEDTGVETILEARDVATGYRLYRRHRPEVVIVDLAMQGNGLSGLDVISRMRSHDPSARILVFSMHSDPIIVARALKAGATGYVLKDTSADELMKAFAQVRSGTPYLSNDVAMQVALVRTGVLSDPLAELTPRELQTLSHAGGRQALRPDRGGAQRQLQDGGQCLLATQAQAQCQEPAGPDPDCRAACRRQVTTEAELRRPRLFDGISR